VYVDNDPLVLAHARALLTGNREGACSYVDADVRDTSTILKQASQTLDLTKPVAVLLLAVLHLIPDADSPAAIVARLADGLAPPSYVAISHMTADFAPEPKNFPHTSFRQRTANSCGCGAHKVSRGI